MFEHSVKVPRHFKIAANIIKKVSTEGGSVKTLLYNEKLRHFRTDVLYALIQETIKHAVDLDKIFEDCSILINEPRLDPWLAKVLATELLFGKKALPGKSKPEQTILSYKEKFQQYTEEHKDYLRTEVTPRRPRYVRINTNLLTTSDAIGAFQEEGYRFIRCTSGSYDDYLKQIQSLSEYDFTQDYHVKTMFVFPTGTKLHEHDLYYENKIILQDKATTLAVHLLAPPPGSVALDMCAAPGMKTTQLAAYIRNQGKIYAVERNEKRYQTLCDFVSKTDSKCVEALHKDALEIKRGDFDDVEYILLDPSCSGSGMELCVHNYIEDTRLAKLTSLQEKFLKHAMNAFPKAKRIVYSTCSLYPEENERVITNVVKTSRAKWRVQDVKELLKGQWNNFGSGMYGSMGTRCLYARPDSDLTIGFFLAVLDRDPKDFDKSQPNEKENLSVNRSKDASNEQSVNDLADDVEDSTFKKKKKKNKDKSKESTEDFKEISEIEKPKKSKRKDSEATENGHLVQTSNIVVAEDQNEGKQGKEKKKINIETMNINHSMTDNNESNTVDNSTNISKKKKKSKKYNSNDCEEIVTALENFGDVEVKKRKSKYSDIESLNKNEDETIDEIEVPKKKKKKKEAQSRSRLK